MDIFERIKAKNNNIEMVKEMLNYLRESGVSVKRFYKVLRKLRLVSSYTILENECK
jgi:hypothetical protein